MYTQFSYRVLLGDKLILWIDPRKVNFITGNIKPISQHLQKRLAESSWPAPIRNHLHKAVSVFHPFVLRDRWYPQPNPIGENSKYQRVMELGDMRDRLSETTWYRMLCDQLQETGKAGHRVSGRWITMKSEKEILSFMENHACALLDSMQKEGYRTDKAPDIPNAMIAADGTLHKSNGGNHRFFIARIFGLDPFPLRVSAVHEKWADDHGIRRFPGGLKRLHSGLRSVEESFR